MTFTRSSGILLHPTSLPGPYGIGDLGPQAYRFVDWLSSAGCKLWQTLPLGPTGYGDSPYQCFSAFAGNPYLISLDELLKDGLLDESDLGPMKDLPGSHVDFGLVIPKKLDILQKAFSNFGSTPGHLGKAFDAFRADNAFWLDDFSLFMAIKESHGGGPWSGWPEELRNRDNVAIVKTRRDLAESVSQYSFYQFLFFRQWNNLHSYTKEKGIQIIGDIPIFVAYDSADVWSHPELFFLDELGNPTVVAGVPPDVFSEDGQLWGNPLYNWDVHQNEKYAWWLSRVRASLKLMDIIRFDHFRGFAGYYAIPAGGPTARNGDWVSAPGKELFYVVKKFMHEELGLAELPIIAEDLGVITPDVTDLLDTFEFPGMRILQFGFSGMDNPYLPHNYVSNCIAYTGTHDNDTSMGWYETASEHEKDFANRYLSVDGHVFAWDLIRAIWKSVAVFTITPMQDALNLGQEARMNYPGRLGGNWSWRMNEDDMREDLAAGLKDLNWLSNR